MNREHETMTKQPAEATTVELHDERKELVPSRDYFAAAVHEIRSPLTTILDLARMAQQGKSEDQMRELLEKLIGAGTNLMQLVDDLLDDAKLDSGSFAINPSPTMLATLIAEILTPIALSCQNEGIALEWAIGADVPNCILVDGLRLRQIITNLVSNARKYTAQGSISLSVDYVAPADSPASEACMLHIAVADTGSGIPADKLDTIFAPFQQASRFDCAIGTGLGLSISQGLVHAMGGQLWIDSEVGHGSTFHFTVAAEAVAAPSDNESLATSLPLPARKLRILIADDNPVNREIATSILSRRGHEVMAVENGRDALAQAACHEIDVFVLDVCMPILNGFETAKALRETEVAQPSTPILALTSHASQRVHDKLLAAGFDSHLVRPLEACALVREIEHAATKAATQKTLQCSREQRAAEPSPSTAPSSAAQTPATDPIEAPIFDLAAALGHVGGQDGLLKVVIEAFACDWTAKRQQLVTAVASGDNSAVYEATHSLAGGAANVGAMVVGKLARRFCTLAAEGALELRKEIVTVLDAEVLRFFTKAQSHWNGALSIAA